MLEININHVDGEYMVDVVCNKAVRHYGLNFSKSHLVVLEMLEEVFEDYKDE